MIPTLDATSYYNFIDGIMIALFVVALIVIFVYEYEVLRRPKSQNQSSLEPSQSETHLPTLG